MLASLTLLNFQGECWPEQEFSIPHGMGSIGVIGVIQSVGVGQSQGVSVAYVWVLVGFL